MPDVRRWLAKMLLGSDLLASKDEARGVADVDAILYSWSRAFGIPSSDRTTAYDELEDMEDDVPEVGVALDTLADEAVYGEEGGTPAPLVHIEGLRGGRLGEDVVDHLQQHVLTPEGLFHAGRGALLRGDRFVQPVVNSDMLIISLMTMPARSMYRQEDDKGVLLRGNRPKEWAFEQRQRGSAVPVAGFYPWEVCHLRWRNDRERDGGLYGKGLFYSSRPSYMKLLAMEEALVINWLTRAFARLLFLIDTTDLSETAARQKVEKVREELTKRQVSPELKEQAFVSVVQDVFLGVGYHDFGGGRPEKGLTDAKVLDTASAGFSNLDPVYYYKRNVLKPSTVPLAYLGFEEEMATRNTLRAVDRRFGRCVRRVQWLLLEPLVVHVVALQMALQGLRPGTFRVLCEWPKPARADEQDLARTLYANARADEIYVKELRLPVDLEWLVRQRYGVQPPEGWGEPGEED